MNKLTVFKTAEGWFVRYDEGPDLDEVLAVMGTDTIPLPWTVQATAEEVVIGLQVRMHNADITLDVSGLHHGFPAGCNFSWTEVPGEVA